MRFDVLLAADGLGSPLTEEQRFRVAGLFKGVGFEETGEGYLLDATFPWATATWDEGRLFVHVRDDLPRHLLDVVVGVLEEAPRAAGLVRMDPVRRALLDPTEWARRLDGLRGR